MSKPSRNEPCSCGSGKKYKKCCGAPGAVVASAVAAGDLPHTQADRAGVFEALELFAGDLGGTEEDDASELFWGRYLAREDELPPELLEMSRAVEDVWFAFDHELEPGVLGVDAILERAPLGRGERAFVEAMRASTLRLYEVVETAPGVSVTLRDLVEGGVVTVSERMGSRQLVRHECVAARVLARGSSGQPEIEKGLLRIPALVRDALVRAVQEKRRKYFAEQPGGALVDFYKSLPPFYHDAWLSCFFDPHHPWPRGDV